MVDYELVVPRSSYALQDAVANHGPVAIYMNSNAKVFQYYSSGILNSAKLCPPRESHAITVVGYGNDGTNEYWICKNSWGTDWGEYGYVKILKTQTTDDLGVCGIYGGPSYAIV